MSLCCRGGINHYCRLSCAALLLQKHFIFNRERNNTNTKICWGASQGAPIALCKKSIPGALQGAQDLCVPNLCEEEHTVCLFGFVRKTN